MRRRPDRRGRRSSALLLTGALMLGLAAGAVACGGEPSSGPTLATVDFSPKLVLTVDDGTIRASAGPKADDRVRTDPPTVPSGAVLEIVNDGREDHRLQAPGLFDTGIMRPGEQTTSVVTNTTSADNTVTITDPTAPEIKGSITVLAGSTPG